MYELVAVAFDGKRRAWKYLEQLQMLNADWTINLHDAVAVYRTDDGRLRVEQSVQPTSQEGALPSAGCSVACLARSSPRRLPRARPRSRRSRSLAPVRSDLACRERLPALRTPTIGRSCTVFRIEFVQQVGGLLRPGESAIFAVFDTGRATMVAEQFRTYGGRVLQTRLTPKRLAEETEAVEVERILNADL